MPENDTQRGLSRRELLKRAGIGGAALLGWSLLGASARDEASATLPSDVYATGGHGQMTVGEDVLSGVYGPRTGPPRGDSLDAATIPPAADGTPAGTVREYELRAEERLIEVAHDVFIEAWTYNGVVPAPIIRATNGDVIVPRWMVGSRSPPGGEMVYEIEAGPAGLASVSLSHPSARRACSPWSLRDDDRRPSRWTP